LSILFLKNKERVLKVKQFFVGLFALIIVLVIVTLVFGGGFLFVYSQFGGELTILQFFIKGLALFVGFLFFSMIFWLTGLFIIKRFLKEVK